MSYCVNCGVELGRSERECPLCGAPVHNPLAPPDEAAEPLFPEKAPIVPPRVRSGLITLLAGLILLIPIGICLFNDYALDGRLDWSLLVGGGEALLFVIVFGPFWFKTYRPLSSALVDGVGVMLYLYLIEFVTGGAWFFRLGLPLAALGTLLSCVFVGVISRKKHVGFFVKVGLFLVLCALYAIAAEWCLTAYFDTLRFQGWSVYAAVPCVIVGTVSFVLHNSPAVKEQLRRRFFI